MNIAEFIFTSIRKKLPSINWNIGSAIRELIATPLVTIAEIINNTINEQTTITNIDEYVSNPEKYSQEINNLFNDLNLNTGTSIEATGKVTILTTSNTPSPVYKNTIFYYDNIPIQVAQDCYPSLIPSTQDNFVQLTQVGYNSYSFEVPVITDGINVNSGVSVTWAEADEDIYALTITSPISGGRTSMTSLEKALKIKDYMAPNVITLNAGIAKMLRDALPNHVVDVAFAQDINDTNKSFLYLKTKKAPSYFYHKVIGKKTEDGLYEINANIPGVINVEDVLFDSKSINIRQLQVLNNTVYCMVECLSDDILIDLTLKVYGLEDASIVQDVLNGYFAGSPYNVEVKTPDIFNIGIEFNYSGVELSYTDLATICENIQNMALNQNISDIYMSDLLATLGATLEGVAIYSVSNIDGLYYKQRISPCIYSKKYSYFAAYSGIDNIKATHV